MLQPPYKGTLSRCGLEIRAHCLKLRSPHTHTHTRRVTESRCHELDEQWGDASQGRDASLLGRRAHSGLPGGVAPLQDSLRLQDLGLRKRTAALSEAGQMGRWVGSQQFSRSRRGQLKSRQVDSMCNHQNQVIWLKLHFGTNNCRDLMRFLP